MKPSRVPLLVARRMLVGLAIRQDAAPGRAAPSPGVGAGAVGSEYRSVMEFRNFTTAISRLSISEVVLASRNMCDSSSVMATTRPEAVLFMASEMARRQQRGLLGRVRLRHRGEGVDQRDDGAEQTDEHADVGQRAQVVRALFEARHDLEQRLFHRLLDVVATTRGGQTRQAVLQHGADLRLRIVRERDGLLEVAGAEVRRDVVPQGTIARGLDGQVQPALDGDGHTDDEYDDAADTGRIRPP